MRAEEDLVATGAESYPGEAEGDGSEADAGREGGGEVDALLGDGAVDEGGEAEDEGGDSGGGEDAVAGEFEPRGRRGGARAMRRKIEV